MGVTQQRELENLLSECPSIRRRSTSEKIYGIVSAETEIVKDPFWRFLPKDLRLTLCCYMTLRHVYDDDGESYVLDAPASSRESSGRLCVLLRGEVNLSCKGYSAVFNGKHGSIFGSLHLPKKLEAFVARASARAEERECDDRSSLYHRFVATLRENGLRVNETNVLVKKGSCFVTVAGKDLKTFIDKLCDRLSSLSVLENLGLRCLRARYSLKSFRRNEIIVREGAESGHVFLLVKGSCHLFKSQDSHAASGIPTSNDADNTITSVEPSFIGSVAAVSFLGFIPHFSEANYQPMTAIASSDVKVLVFSAPVFLKGIKNIDGMAQAFLCIANQQMKWLTRTLPLMLKAEMITSGEDNSGKTAACAGLDAQSPAPPLEQHNIIKSSLDIENIMNSRIPKNPKLNRHKILNEALCLVRNEEKVVELMEYEDPLDPFSRFDFIDTEGYAREEPIELEWFPPVEATSTFNFGRSLLPFPSILLSRKMYGKTLPAVEQSHGFSNPFA